VPIVHSSSSLSAALAADAAIVAYLRALADQRAAELTPEAPPSGTVGRWATAPLTRGRYQRVVLLREPRRLERVVSSRGESRAAQTREAR
jgi:hypothetical protein